MKNRHIGWTGRWWHQLALGLSLLLTAAVAQAQVTIQSVTGTVQGGVEVVKIDLSDVLSTPPTGFSIQSPARIALDFPDVSSAMGRSTVEVNQGNLRSVNVVQAGTRTRVVLNLKQATTYTTQWQGKSLLVVLGALPGSVPAPSTQMFAENQSRDVQPLRDLDFRRGTEGAGRVVVSLPNSQVGVDVRQQGQLLVVEFMKTSLPEGLTSVGTLVNIRHLAATPAGQDVRVIAEVTEIDRRRFVFQVDWWDETEKVGEGVHERYVIDIERFLERVEAKKKA